jgi:sugar-specific transcriptional regulator TrmB
MKEELLELGLNKKEIEVFLYLINFWISSASEVANKLGYPKSSINFLADNLWKRGILKKSFRWRTGYYEADIWNLEETILDEISNKKDILNLIIPVLKEKSKNTFERTKIIFIDWIESCKKEYFKIIDFWESTKWEKEYFEIWAHWDLENAFWEEFMNNFIKLRIKSNLICNVLSNNWKIEKRFSNKDYKELRKLKLFEESIFWKIYSTVAIYDNKVLILNLNWKNSWVLIENKEFYETMKTVFKISKI